MTKKLYSELQVGEIRTSIVTNLVDHGAFVDLLGVVGLLHISELDWIEHNHPSEVLTQGGKIETKVLEVDGENECISLSRKALITPSQAHALSTETSA